MFSEFAQEVGAKLGLPFLFPEPLRDFGAAGVTAETAAGVIFGRDACDSTAGGVVVTADAGEFNVAAGVGTGEAMIVSVSMEFRFEYLFGRAQERGDSQFALRVPTVKNDP
jgi:hypothetical protein